MFLNNCVVAALAACASVVLALPRPDAFELSLPGGEDHGWEYKRGVAETFVCKRGNDESLTCLRKKEVVGEVGDQSKTASKL
ncbi:7aa1cdbf-3f5d-479d-beac-52372b2783cf [Thermothielavioides terrestris]|uniref:7aa1cdbf-3f5d-479d-beac-52372b2783cf n=1 Tax=Thermothielavioides terrestris TaxID=2587410 RepID=A0A446BPJ9_9PEZI|nr:7aa1cdbf-3f5d-479d-beac-52372b2783cf [Thermothielavioides terrestris]